MSYVNKSDRFMQKQCNLGKLNCKQSQLEQRLLRTGPEDSFLVAIQQFEDIYKQNRAYEKMIEIERQKKQKNIQVMKKLKQRIAGLNRADQQNQKNSKNMAVQTHKIKQSFTLNKILMMQKIIRLQRQTQDIQSKKTNCEKLKKQRILRTQQRKIRSKQENQKIRLRSLNHSRNLKIQLQNQRNQDLSISKDAVRNIRSEKDRLRRKSMHIQQFKRQRAFKNYLEKVIAEKQKIQERQLMLGQVKVPQIQQNHKIKSYIEIRKPKKKNFDEEINSFFTTQANSLEQQS